MAGRVYVGAQYLIPAQRGAGGGGRGLGHAAGLARERVEGGRMQGGPMDGEQEERVMARATVYKNARWEEQRAVGNLRALRERRTYAEGALSSLLLRPPVRPLA